MARSEIIEEQVFDRRGNYLGKVVRASLDGRGVASYEISLDAEAAREIFGVDEKRLRVDPIELTIDEVVRLSATISDLKVRASGSE